MLIIGYYPGTTETSGVALLDMLRGDEPTAWVETCNHVDHALALLISRLGDSIPDAAGICACLSWSTGQSGWRLVDTTLSKAYPRVDQDLFPVTCAPGIRVMQGMAMALRLQELWPHIKLNETHPKVLYSALSEQRFSFGSGTVDWLRNLFTPPLRMSIRNEHQWGALVSAWATWMGETGRWNGDLMIGAQNLLFPAGEVTYFWP